METLQLLLEKTVLLTLKKIGVLHVFFSKYNTSRVMKKIIFPEKPSAHFRSK